MSKWITGIAHLLINLDKNLDFMKICYDRILHLATMDECKMFVEEVIYVVVPGAEQARRFLGK